MIIKVTGTLTSYDQVFKVNLDVEVPEDQIYQGKRGFKPLRSFLDKREEERKTLTRDGE